MNKILKIFIIILLGIFIVKPQLTYVNAAVNSDYKTITVNEDNTLDDNIEEENAETTVGDIIMQYLGRFVFSLAKLVESAITNFSKWLVGVDVFPWEDYIVFNSLPYLDINYFNPANGSIFTIGESVTVGDMIRSVYFSLLTMALVVLGIGVAVTAIRLAIASIAAEKAKYKEAITKCLYTVVMLFSVHLLISFIFYLNETIVQSCSALLKNIIQEQEMAQLQEAISSQDLSDNYTFADNNAYPYDADGINALYKSKKGWEYVFSDKEREQMEEYDEMMAQYRDVTSSEEGAAVFSYLIHQVEYVQARSDNGDPNDHDKIGYYVDLNKKLYDVSGLNLTPGLAVNTLRRILEDTQKIVETDKLEDLEPKFEGVKGKDKAYKYIETAAKKFILGESDANAIANIISSLGEYFKGQVETIKDVDKFNYVALILYAILLIQSIMLLISYVKRVFYVTLLTILAPIVVIYDFFISAI